MLISGANGLLSTVVQLSMGAGITLGAMFVRAGHLIAGELGLNRSGVDSHIALLLVGGVALFVLIDAISLKPGAADHFVS